MAWTDSREGSFDSDAQLAYPGGSEAVLAPTTFANAGVSKPVIVAENDVAAAMAGAVLSRAALAPMLVSPAGGLTPELATEIRRIAALGAYLLGDAAVLSGTVGDDVAAAGVPSESIIRISGTSPAELAAAVAAAMDRRNGDDREAGAPAFDAAVVANPATADAASATALAAALRLPFLYVDTDLIPSATTEALDSLGIDRTLVIGGPGAISDVVLSRLPSPRRLGGESATATSEAVATEGLVQRLPRNQLFVGDVADSFDSALLGAAAARLGGVLLLQDAADPNAAMATANRLGIANDIDRLVTLGASGSLPTSRSLTANAQSTGTLPATGSRGISVVAALTLVLWLAIRRAMRISSQEGPCQAQPKPMS